MSWKDHPVIVAAVSAAATVAFCVTTLLPIWTKVQENRVENLAVELDSLKKNLDIANADADRYRKQNIALTTDTLFIPSDLYPRGFRDIRIGDPIEKVLSKYKNVKKESRNNWYSAKIDDSAFFDRATYYFDDEASRRVVTLILIFFKDRVADDVETSPQQVAVQNQIRSICPNAKFEAKQKKFSPPVISVTGCGKVTAEIGPDTYTISPSR